MKPRSSLAGVMRESTSSWTASEVTPWKLSTSIAACDAT